MKTVSKDSFLDDNQKLSLYNEDIAEKASSLAKLKEDKSFVLSKQLGDSMDYPKAFKGVILEGRDCGTVIAPKAD